MTHEGPRSEATAAAIRLRNALLPIIVLGKPFDIHSGSGDVHRIRKATYVVVVGFYAAHNDRTFGVRLAFPRGCSLFSDCKSRYIRSGLHANFEVPLSSSL